MDRNMEILGESSSANNRSDNIQEELAVKRWKTRYSSAFLKNMGQGLVYEINVLIRIALKLLYTNNERDWWLGAEVRDARGFHNVVLKYIDNTANGNEQVLYRFTKIKYKAHLSRFSRIGYNELTSANRKEQFSLIYLFNAYLGMIGRRFEDITPDQIMDLTVFTNKSVYTNIQFLEQLNRDGIFDFEEGECYGVNTNMIPDILMISFEDILRKKSYNRSLWETIISDFLRKLRFVVNQPSQSKIETLIIQDMTRYLTPSQPNISEDYVKQLYKNLFHEMCMWFIGFHNGKKPYLTENFLKRFVEKTNNALQSIRFENEDLEDAMAWLFG